MGCVISNVTGPTLPASRLLALILNTPLSALGRHEVLEALLVGVHSLQLLHLGVVLAQVLLRLLSHQAHLGLSLQPGDARTTADLNATKGQGGGATAEGRLNSVLPSHLASYSLVDRWIISPISLRIPCHSCEGRMKSKSWEV